ncbi:MAG: AraC family transcriptional regulator [Pseudanabaenaceae cyanobacterium bins.68]|nr:AraC family transcriptional regulator [Pseudanabaenaceae cyanobacterium bins.68]
MNEATFSISLIRNAIQYAVARYEIEIDVLCKAIDISPELLNQPDYRVSGGINRAMWREVINHTQDQNIGLHMGEIFNPSAIGILGYVLFNCENLQQVLEKLSRYMSLFSQGVEMNFAIEGSQVLWNCDISRHYKSYLLEESRQPMESTLSAMISAIKILTGKQIQFASVWFQHPTPADISEHQRIFQAPILFSQSTNRLIFDYKFLEWKILSANANLLSTFEHYADLMLSQSISGYANQVVKKITQGLKAEVPSLEAIAQSLHMSVRNLQRELHSENTSYQKLLDQTRKELAICYLRENNSINNIAFLLGFAEPSAFHRAFKRWTGKTPQSYRSKGRL